MQFYFGTVVLYQVSRYLSHYRQFICRTAQHYIVLFFILCPLSRYVFIWLRRSNGPSPMQSAVYLSINYLSSKMTTQNKYSINLTFLDYKYNWIKGLINRYKEVFLVGWRWNRIIWNVVRHLKSDRKIFVVKLS